MSESLLLIVACAALLFLLKSRRNYLALPELPARIPSEFADVTIIIPARNEAHQIQKAIASFAGLPVVVVNDHSEDETAVVSRHSGARVLDAPPLTGGARGKPNACFEGARNAQSRWLCFVDADTWFDPQFAGSLIAYAEHEQLDLVSVFLRSHRESFAENLLLPYAFALYFTGVHAGRVNSRQSREALANGQCMLFRRDSYFEIGGHQSVLSSVVEDVALASLAKKRGLRTRVIRSETMGHVRMYDGLGAIWNGFRKNSFRFLLINPRTGVEVIAASVLLTSWLPLAAYALATGIHGRLWFTFLFFLAAPSIGLWPWYGNAFSLLAPAAIYAFQLIALDGMASTLTSRKAVWKGRHV